MAGMRSSLKGSRAVKVLLPMLLVLLALSVAGCTANQTADMAQESPSGGGVSAPMVEPQPPGDGRATPEGKIAADPYAGEDQAAIGIVPPSGAGPDASGIPPEDRLIIRRVDMRLGVESIEDAIESIRTAVEKQKGVVIDLNVSTDEDQPVWRYSEMMALEQIPLSGYITVRIPAEGLEAFLAEMAGIGNVLREVESQSDVTQEHVDMSARLKNLQATEAQLRDFMTKAKNVTEMLAVEKELSRVRGEIESMQAQIAYLERQAAHSTVTIELTGPKPVVRPVGQDWGFLAALTESVRAFVGTINMLIVAVGAVGPIVVILLLVWLVARPVIKRRRAKRSDEAAEEVDAS